VDLDADVVVIGAGAAGLAAARCVAEQALRVILLEARDRVGGRVTAHPTSRALVPAELGAEFIHGAAAETAALLREAGSAAIDNEGGNSWVFGEKGVLERDSVDFASAAAIFERVRSLPHDETVENFLRRFENDPSMRDTAKRARTFAESFDAADPSIASALSLADEIASGVDSTSARPIGGYGPMFDRMRAAANAAGVVIRLAMPVQRVAWRPGRVDVDVHRGNETLAFHARAAVITLPVGVLRQQGDATSVAFDPPLPSAKRAALEKIEMGQVVKVMLWFRTPFWQRLAGGRFHDAAFFRDERGPFGAYWTQYPVRSESIAAWAGGTRAIALHGRSRDELIELALTGFGKLLGEPALARDELEGAALHDWNGDPYARGAYSYVALDGGNAREALGAPVDDTLFFAGEATSNDGQGGTVNGAIETGERAARQAVAALRAAR
jgi:monoamine oxidase